MQTLLDVRQSNSVLDLGGQPGTWDHPSLPPLSVTLVNLPGVVQPSPSGPHTFEYIEGDACNVGYLKDRSYDLVFSNSVIEHVGKPERQTQFADQIRRLGKSYWVQTPSPWFPVEAHTGVPFWWLYPAFVRRAIIRRWRKKLPAWTDMIEGTTVLRKKTLQRLFPEATIIVERMFALPKSYIAVKSNVAVAGATPCRPHPPSASHR